MRKTIATTISLSLLCLLLASCGQPQDKTFEKAGMSITLTDPFSENDAAAFTAYYSSLDAMVTALKEEFTLFEQAGLNPEMSLAQYGEIVMLGNGVESTIEETDGVNYFIYEKQANGKDITYLATLSRGADAYWLIQFACESKNFDTMQAQFIDWAKTIQV